MSRHDGKDCNCHGAAQTAPADDPFRDLDTPFTETGEEWPASGGDLDLLDAELDALSLEEDVAAELELEAASADGDEQGQGAVQFEGLLGLLRANPGLRVTLSYPPRD